MTSPDYKVTEAQLDHAHHALSLRASNPEPKGSTPMTNNYPPRPSQDSEIPQWTQADLKLASQRGEVDRIEAARLAGQLETLLNTPDPATVRSVRTGDRRPIVNN